VSLQMAGRGGSPQPQRGGEEPAPTRGWSCGRPLRGHRPRRERYRLQGEL